MVKRFRLVKYYLLNSWYLLRNTKIYTALVCFGIYLYVRPIKNAPGGGVYGFLAVSGAKRT